MKPEKSGWWYWPPMTIARYWLVQGTLYMNWIERLHRWTIEFLLFLGTYFVISAFIRYPANALWSVFVAHTLSALLNGHIFALFAHDLFWFSFYKDRKSFIYYIENIRGRLQRKNPSCVCDVLIFGSLVRGNFKASSDLDIRYIANDGIWNALCTASWVFFERVHALLAGFPIDIYMFRNRDEMEKKIDFKNEKPVCVYYHGSKLRRMMPDTVSFENFKLIFLSSSMGSDS